VPLSDVPSHAPGVVGRVIQGEAVLVHPGQGKVRVLNEVGARLWELADGKRTIAEMARVIADEYAVDAMEAQSDAAAFCADLAGRGLLHLSS
jgi:hypothetical protein